MRQHTMMPARYLPVVALLALFLAIAACTYIVEYAMFQSHGAFLTTLHPTPAVVAASARWSTMAGQTWIRLPLFASWAAMLAAVARRIAVEVL